MIVKIRDRKKTKFTRMCIGEAMILLMKSKKYYELKVSEIVKRAGVSRMSFYRYYQTPYDALKDYLEIIVEEYLQESRAIQERTTWFEYQHILFSLNFFDRYRGYFLTMAQNGLHSILLDGVNSVMMDAFQTSDLLSRYEMYSYAGGLMNSFLKWEEGGKVERAEDVAGVIYRLYHAKEE